MASPFVLVVGSINEDLVVRSQRLPAPGETVTGGTYAQFGGGKGANQAVAAARMGAEVLFVGAVGDDDLGELAITRLASAGVDPAAVTRVAGVATGVALVVVDVEGENQIAVASGANQALDADRVSAYLADARLPDSGVFLANLEIGDDALLAGARFAAARGYQLIVNPAPPRRLADELLDLGPILTPNEGEVRTLAGCEEHETAARMLAARTHAPVVVTLGGEGSLLVLDGQTTRFAAPAVDVVDTTGAGDAFNGILAARLAAGMEISSAVRWATTGAALGVSEQGARKTVATCNAVQRAIENTDR